MGRKQCDQIWQISPQWQNFTSLWQMFDGSFLIWQNVERTWAKLIQYWANFDVADDLIY